MSADRPHARYALSTMWAMQPRFENDIVAFVHRAAELGYSAVEINHSMDAPMSEAILASRVLPVASVHAPAPLTEDPTRGWNRDLNLASLDEDERSLAVRYTQRSIDLAAEAAAPFVVVHLGHAGRPLDSERRLRELWPRRDRLGAEYARTVDDTVRERAAVAPPHLAAARHSLADLVAYAGPRNIALGLESRLLYHEIPLPEEAAALLAPYEREVAGYWHDVGHCEVHHRLGLTDLSAWFDLLGERLIGAHIHDVRELTDHRAPGEGSIDYSSLATRLPATAARTLEIDQHEPDVLLTRAIDVLDAAGI